MLTGIIVETEVRRNLVGAGKPEIHLGGWNLGEVGAPDLKGHMSAILGLDGTDRGLKITLTVRELGPSISTTGAPEAWLILRSNLQLQLAINDTDRTADVPLLGVDFLSIEIILPDRLQARIRSSTQRQGGKEGEKREGFHKIGVRMIKIGDQKEASPTLSYW